MRRHLVPYSTIACAMLAMLATTTSAPAAEAPGPNTPYRVVSYADLDLNRTEGVVRLYARIRAAAREVCPVANRGDLNLVAVAETCARDATARAVRDVNATALTQYHMIKTNQRMLLAQRH